MGQNGDSGCGDGGLSQKGKVVGGNIALQDDLLRQITVTPSQSFALLLSLMEQESVICQCIE